MSAVIFPMVIAILLTLSCSEQPGTAPSQPVTPDGDTFTFFEVGRTTILNNHLRRDLKGVLGDVAIESRNIIDLDINYRGFLKEHFPDIDTVNRQLISSNDFPECDSVP